MKNDKGVTFKMGKIMDVSLTFDSKDEGTIIVGTKQRIRSFNLPGNKKIIGDKILIKYADQSET
ncbi:hypothetical protein [Paenibacillus sp. TY11]|uniref:hypothetical protein n=1 Tax=Paenibacillus sp. TY11 TaxID=3448633 RepID=UPI0040390C4D